VAEGSSAYLDWIASCVADPSAGES
jgi:hypothetical protein